MQGGMMSKRNDHIRVAPRKIPTLGSILDSMAGTVPEFSKLNTIMTVLSAWRETVGEKISNVTQVVKFENGILFIKVTSSVWRNEFFHIEEEIKAKLRAKLGKIKLTKIMFV
jgi:predicted nucleic acid-binding Zn ribbon protein